MVSLENPTMTNTIKHILIYVAACICCTACTITDPEADPLQDINSVFLGTQILDFKSAKLTITGPANITSVNSHVRARLDLSSEDVFQEPFPENSRGMSIQLYSVNNGFDLPKFPLENGTYDVFPSEGITNPDIINTLVGTSFTYGPSIGIGYNPGFGTYANNHYSSSGAIQIVFDVKNSRVKLTYDYLTSGGTRVSGSNNLPLNLGSFTP